MASLLKELSRNPQFRKQAQLAQVFDQLAARIERFRDPQAKARLMSGLARYYQQIGLPDRATALLTRAIQFTLKQPDARFRAADLGLLLTTASELKQTPKIASLLDSMESAIVPLIPPAPPTEIATQIITPLALAQAYLETQQPAKALRLVDQVAKVVPINWQNPDLARLYLQLGQEAKAKPYLNTILKGYIPEDDRRYAVLVAAYDAAKHPLSQQLFNQAWNNVQSPLYDSQGDFVMQYFAAGGNPDRLAQVLRSSSPQIRVNHLLLAAGAYRQRNQPQKSSQMIAQFLQAVQQLQNRQDGTNAIGQAIAQGYLPEANIAFQQLAGLSAIAVNPYSTISVAQAADALGAVEPTVQRLIKTDPALRTDLLQQLAIAYAQQQHPKQALLIAAQMPFQDSDPTRSPQIETLAQIATVLHQVGQTAAAQTVFAQALNATARVSALHLQATAYGAIARAYTKTGQRDAAETARQNAVKAAKAVQADPNNGFTSDYMLSLVSQQFLNHQQVEAAWRTLREISLAGYKETNIDNLIVTAIQSGQLDIARQASELINTYQTPDAFSQIAPTIAQAYLSRNRSTEAIALLDRTTQIWNNQKERSVNTLIELIRLYAQLGRIDTARHLLANYPTSSQASVSLRQELQQYVNCYAQRSVVRDSKGSKSRVTMLPSSVAAELRDHLVGDQRQYQRGLS
uniref:tetratricopeptide repeat protein n=1 Tax=Trichocoleus desertorum TaxID=1481672 RepID=UPI0025B33F03|nr:hypothetical protein [Trichocoleus desertorum]